MKLIQIGIIFITIFHFINTNVCAENWTRTNSLSQKKYKNNTSSKTYAKFGDPPDSDNQCNNSAWDLWDQALTFDISDLITNENKNFFDVNNIYVDINPPNIEQNGKALDIWITSWNGKPINSLVSMDWSNKSVSFCVGAEAQAEIAGIFYQSANLLDLQKIMQNIFLWYDEPPEINPPDPEDTETENDDDNLPGSTTSQGFSSSSRPELYVSKLSFRDDKTKYYDDETIHLDGYVKNGGKSVDGKIKKIAFKIYRFKGEKENGDVKEVGDENIKGENLSKGKTKHEEFSFGAPSTEAKYQLYAVIDAKNAVSESNEKNNRSGSIAFRVHKRPDIKVDDLSFKDGQVLFEVGEIPKARVTFINSGGEPFQDVPVKWYVDGEHFAYDNMRHWKH